MSVVGNTPVLDPSGEAGLLVISRGTAIALLGVYVAYLVFQVGVRTYLVFSPLTIFAVVENPSGFVRGRGIRTRRTENERHRCCHRVCCHAAILVSTTHCLFPPSC